jgi:hypothetical protein
VAAARAKLEVMEREQRLHATIRAAIQVGMGVRVCRVFRFFYKIRRVLGFFSGIWIFRVLGYCRFCRYCRSY